MSDLLALVDFTPHRPRTGDAFAEAEARAYIVIGERVFIVCSIFVSRVGAARDVLVHREKR